MSDEQPPAAPIHLDRGRHLDLHGRAGQPWLRRAGLAALALVPLLGLANVFGQEPSRTEASSSAGGSLIVEAPDAVRGGLIYEVRIEVRAADRIEQPVLVFDRGWFEGLTMNTLVPSPADETSEDGRVVFGYPPLPAGERLVVWMQFQANPISVGRQQQDVELRDGDVVLATVERDTWVYP